MSIVRRRCLAFIEELLKLGYAKEIPLETAKAVFLQRGFGFDRFTMRAYFGSQKGYSTRKMQKIARYASGTISFKSIELSQEIQGKKGYLELLGLATIEKKGSVWFLILTNEALVPQIKPNNHERLESIEELSLSTYSSSDFEGKGSEGKPCGVPSNVETAESTTNDIKNNNNLQGERDKFQIEPELQALANAQPSSESDKARVKWEVDSDG